ncbi:MAG: hypothetical protein K9G24_02965 [Candidatus Nanopelagicales bacterium]|nr:hypothetical protein [Candidatus Nanopelagicales bacterium]MCF8536895.1 hypothetical protein [Candidatus Nanopelagicales bacterium]MCF8542025.1 hypothetical protein [Candidatus Nanopelagicales bacterium]MCF8556713.1 hypothetical protein [Candidatus Nanopelagicales bacterium]
MYALREYKTVTIGVAAAVVAAFGVSTLAAPADASTCATGGACALGDIGPGGGLVFLVIAGTAYEMAPQNWNDPTNASALDPNLVWCTSNVNVSSAADYALGAGAANTANMNDPTKGCSSSPAASAVLAYPGTNSSAGQWFLPSYTELNAMCNYSRDQSSPNSPATDCWEIGVTQSTAFASGSYAFGALGAENLYWSSTQTSSGYASVRYVGGNGYAQGLSQSSSTLSSIPTRVRPIRSFSVPLPAQTVSWTPSNTSASGSSTIVTPDALASTDGDGAISYSVSSAGTTGCSVDGSAGVLTLASPGTCQVQAMAAATASWASGSTTVSFTLTAPAPAPDPGGGSTAPAVEPAAPEPVVEEVDSTVVETPEPVQAPVIVVGVPDNPVTPVVVTPGVVLLGEGVAAATPTRTMAKAAGSRIGRAPKAPAIVGEPVSLVASGLTSGVVYSVRMKTPDGYVLVGATAADAAGLAQLPVMTVTRKGTYTLAITDPAAGDVSYIKVRVAPRG